ncbi:hypothetical protein CXG81DRAFT_24900 [Caulochytrium protostelioides]|uniref:Uncharacterized protein n=1 Tax=Caulochytrium protostelioides TaxID=1555241 RepID=A0A4P9XAP5_9FUNG|nr:hypothetical protein CXG81DRAFT_24900 [Caulochytrium protostelioides]|eukprot:RKP02438.1 hypothetical protein CXG81DRAFT_24900 [Caulochytrium protostelioides]
MLAPLDDDRYPGVAEPADGLQDLVETSWADAQQKLFARMENQSLHLTQLMREQNQAIRGLEEDKLQLGTALDATSRRLQQADAQTGATAAERDRLRDERAAYAREAAKLAEVLRTTESHLATVHAEAAKLRTQHEAQVAQTQKMHQLAMALDANSRVHVALHDRLEREIDFRDSENKSLAKALESKAKKADEIVAGQAALVQAAQDQQSETRQAQAVIRRMHHEIEQLRRESRVHANRWIDVQKSMSQRDAVLATLHQKQKTMAAVTTTQDAVVARLENDKAQLTKAVDAKTAEATRLRDQVAALTAQVEQVQREAKLGYHSMTVLNATVDAVGGLEQKIVTKDAALLTAKGVLGELRHAYETLRRSRHTQASNDAVHQRAQIKEAEDAGAAAAQRRVDADSVLRERQLAKKVNDLALMKTQLESRTEEAEHDAARSRGGWQQLDRMYQQLWQHANQLTYTLETREHAIADLEATVATLKTDSAATALREGLRTAQADAQDARAETDAMRRLWQTTQRDLQKLRGEHDALQARQATQATLLTVRDGTQSHLNAELTNVTATNGQLRGESDALRRKIQQLTQQLLAERQQRHATATTVIERDARIEEKKVHHTTAMQLMRAEVDQLHHQLATQRRSELQRENAHIVDESVAARLQERLGMARSEKQQLEAAYRALKAKSDNLARTNIASKLQIRQLENALSLRLCPQDVEGTRTAWMKLGTSPLQGFPALTTASPPATSSGTASTSSTPLGTAAEPDRHVAPLDEFRSTQLHQETLVTELAFHKSQLALLKKKMKTLTRDNAVLKEQMADVAAKGEDAVRRAEALSRDLATEQRRSHRARQLAAYLEKELLQLRPNTQLVQEAIEAAEPTIHLLAALQV